MESQIIRKLATRPATLLALLLAESSYYLSAIILSGVKDVKKYSSEIAKARATYVLYNIATVSKQVVGTIIILKYATTQT